MVYADGHVATANDDYAYNTQTWANYIGGLTGQATGRQFEDTLDILETEAQGLNPVNTMALPGYPFLAVGKYTKYPQHSFATGQGVSWK